MTPAEPGGPLSRHRILWLAAGVLGVLLLAAAVWTGVNAVRVSGELSAAKALAGKLQSEVAGGDLAGAQRTARRLAVHARAAAASSGDPVWRAGELLPLVGANLAAARVVASELDHLSRGVINPALGLAANLTGIWSSGGVDLDVLSGAAGPLRKAVRVVAHSRQQLESIDNWALLEPIRQGVQQLNGFLADAEPMVRDAGSAAQAIPAVLGKDGPRSILVMLQNGAELRTGGGLTGAFAELRADHGAVTIVDQASSNDFPRLTAPLLPMPSSVTTLFDDTIARYVMNISSPADFQVSAKLASEWWAMRTGHRPDTIVSMDVDVLSALLHLTGPVEVAGWGPLTSDNLVDRLLVQPYMTLDSEDQDALFAKAVSAVFTQALTTNIDAATLFDTMAGPVADGRISIWSTDPEMEALAERSAFAGPHARQVQAGDEAFAVYLNDMTGAKMDTYLQVGIDAAVGYCRADGLRDVAVTVTLTNTAPPDAGRRLPISMTGGGRYGVPAGDIGTLLAVAAPAGTFIGGVTRGEEHFASVSGDIDGYPVTQSQITVPPGQSETLKFHFVAAQAGDIRPQILHTPLINPPALTRTKLDCG